MDVFETIKKRKSIRSYKPIPIPEESLIKVIEAARMTPSAGNIQPWHFIMIKDEDKRKRIAKGCRYGKFLSESPIIIVACGNKKTSPHWYVIDTAIALEHLVLAATDIGLGTCWIGNFNQEDIRKMLRIPKKFEVIALMALGYPYKKVDIVARLLHLIRPRKKINEILSLENYSEKLTVPFNTESNKVRTSARVQYR